MSRPSAQTTDTVPSIDLTEFNRRVAAIYPEFPTFLVPRASDIVAESPAVTRGRKSQAQIAHDLTAVNVKGHLIELSYGYAAIAEFLEVRFGVEQGLYERIRDLNGDNGQLRQEVATMRAREESLKAAGHLFAKVISNLTHVIGGTPSAFKTTVEDGSTVYAFTMGGCHFRLTAARFQLAVSKPGHNTQRVALDTEGIRPDNWTALEGWLDRATKGTGITLAKSLPERVRAYLYPKPSHGKQVAEQVSTLNKIIGSLAVGQVIVFGTYPVDPSHLEIRRSEMPIWWDDYLNRNTDR